MRQGSNRSLIVLFVMAALLSGCAGGGRIQTAEVRSGKMDTLPIQAASFYFCPNAIRVDKPGPLAIELKNVSGWWQNFTLKDPAWKTLVNVDIPPGDKTAIDVELCMPGVYRFYCNKTWQTLYGMNGQIFVGE